MCRFTRKLATKRWNICCSDLSGIRRWRRERYDPASGTRWLVTASPTSIQRVVQVEEKKFGLDFDDTHRGLDAFPYRLTDGVQALKVGAFARLRGLGGKSLIKGQVTKLLPWVLKQERDVIEA